MGKDIIKEHGLGNDYKQINLNGKIYILRRPTAMQEIELQDNNVDIDGNVDVYGYIKGILKFVTPEIEIKDVVKKLDDTIIVGDKTISFKNLKIEDAFRIILSTSKAGKNSNGERVMKLNQSEAIKKIIEYSDKGEDKKPLISINDFKKSKELSEVLQKFQELFDVEGAMNIYSTFQDTISD
ncbi:MAG: hypothetical protein ACRCVJ_16500 [Clostridium sp.]|uniref:hypothetical protein n=1 Tax=Clostridium sp. TaxID=1506 RepID=UPI003F2FD52C